MLAIRCWFCSESFPFDVQNHAQKSGQGENFSVEKHLTKVRNLKRQFNLGDWVTEKIKQDKQTSKKKRQQQQKKHPKGREEGKTQLFFIECRAQMV